MRQPFAYIPRFLLGAYRSMARQNALSSILPSKLYNCLPNAADLTEYS